MRFVEKERIAGRPTG